MRSGSLIVIPFDFDLEQLNGLLWDREEEGHRLKSLIQFEHRFNVETGVQAIEALAIHQSIRDIPVLQEVAGRYRIDYVESVRTEFSRIYTLPGLVVVDTLKNRGFVSDIINRGLRNNVSQTIYLDTARMANDHRDQWERRFTDRAGRVNKGALYGDGVEQDSIFGPELDRSRTGSVGWHTNFFGSLYKVKVSPRGSVTLWSNPRMDTFLRFLRYEIIPYAVYLS